MDYLPLFADIRNQPCLVVGGGSVARRKVDLLLRASAAVTVNAPELDPELADFDEEEAEAEEEEEEEAGPDLLLRETARIVADMVELESDLDLLKRQFAQLD